MGTPSNPFIESLNSGEFSPRMEARVTFERYANAARMCRNMLLLPQGGMTRRPGTRFVKEVKDSSVNTIILPFQFSESDAWIVEAGSVYFRFYRRQARVDVADTAVAVTNGTFTGNASGWTLGGTAAYGTNRVDFPASGDTAAQTISVAAGDRSKQHVLAFQIAGIGSMDCTITDNAATVLATRDVTEGYHLIGFITGAGSTSITITFTSNGSTFTTGATLYLDNVSLLDNAAMEITTPYATADLEELRFFQAADVVYICHQDYQTRRLERHGTYSWSLETVTFLDGPWMPTNELNSDVEFFDPEVYQLVLNPFFENGLQNWTDSSTGDGHIFHTSVGAELDDGTSGGSGVANLRTSFSGASDASDFIIWSFVVNQTCTLDVGTTAGGTEITTGTLQPGWNRTQISSTAATIHLEYHINGHTGERTGVGAVLVYGSRARLLDPSATTGSVTVAAIGFSPFASTDVGRSLRIGAVGQEWGWGIITAFSSSTSVTLQVMSELPTATATPDWAFGAFGGEQGHPKTSGFIDGRLAFANTTEAPQSLWLSQSGDLENMQPDSFSEGTQTVEDSDAIAVTLNSKRIDPILWLAEVNDLILGTAGAQWSVDSIGGVVTPTDIFAKTNSALPAGDMEVLAVNQALIFTDKTKRELYEIAYSTEESGYIPTLLTVFADHIFTSPAHILSFQRAPRSVVWAPRDDGRIATLSYNRQHQVLGWSQQILGGDFSTGDAVVEHIAVIPGIVDATQTNDSDERDEVWVIVKRTINGETKRYIEFFEKEFFGPLREDYNTNAAWWTQIKTDQQDAFYVDSGITYDGSSTTSITGLTHLEGQTVKVLADGKVHPDKTVSSGAITLDYAASKVQVGLGYTSRYLSLKLPTGAQAGTAVNKQKAITGCGVVVLDTGTFDIATVDHDDDTGREIHDLYTFDFRLNQNRDLSEAIPVFSGESYKALDTNFSTDPRLYIETDAPLPLTLLGLAPMIEGTDEPET
jgi:hypothetical protein